MTDAVAHGLVRPGCAALSAAALRTTLTRDVT